MKKQELLRTALDTYGAEKQTLKTVEEIGELLKELSKNAWGEENHAHIAEEIADVRIMLDQMEMLHRVEYLCHGYEKAKLHRLAKRLGVEYA